MSVVLGAEPAPTPTPPTEGDLIVRPDSIALRRLIEEVELGETINLESYNRTYHRHNR
jgi:hypothetical protein